jgi:hypothetical protein
MAEVSIGDGHDVLGPPKRTRGEALLASLRVNRDPSDREVLERIRNALKNSMDEARLPDFTWWDG